ncbi:MAG: SPOR domain-containing protein, partial [Candidatus Binatia bacterium]
FHPGIGKSTMIRFKSSENTKFAVEVGQYFDEILASNEITRLRQKGLEPYMEIVEDRSGNPAFSVRMGSFGDRTVAERYAVKISNEKGLELRVVQVN